MNHFTFKLKDYCDKYSDYPTVRAYIHEQYVEFGKRYYPSIVVLPGGGYHATSQREAEPVAVKFYSEGYNVFILDYTIMGKGQPYPDALREACGLIKLVREKKEEWNCTDQVAVIGFSAGGHLASMVATQYDGDAVVDFLGDSPRPDACILGYPVTTGGEYAHRGSFINMTGSEDVEKHQMLDSSKFVSERTCPVFLFHTANDDTVPVQNTLIFAKELADNKVPFECHIYPDGVHGLSLATEMTNTVADRYFVNERVSVWFDECIKFLKMQGIAFKFENKSLQGER